MHLAIEAGKGVLPLLRQANPARIVLEALGPVAQLQPVLPGLIPEGPHLPHHMPPLLCRRPLLLQPCLHCSPTLFMKAESLATHIIV